MIGVDLVPERLGDGRGATGSRSLDPDEHDDVADAAARADRRPRARRRRSTRSAWRRTARRSAKLAQTAAGLLPDAVAAHADREGRRSTGSRALRRCIDTVRRGGTVSISGVYGGLLDPLPMMQLFDKGMQLRMGQAHVKRWIDEILPLRDRRRRPARHRGPRHPHARRSRRRRTATRSSRRSRTARSRSSCGPARRPSAAAGGSSGATRGARPTRPRAGGRRPRRARPR